MVIALLLAAAAPSAEALALGRQIAEAGTMASFIELVVAVAPLLPITTCMLTVP